jgi:hypothetical protein
MYARFFLVMAGTLILWFAWEKRRQVAFEQHFPPLSDNEFVARCTPGIDRVVALKVRRILADCLCVEYERIYPSSRLVEDLGAE